MRRVLLCLVVLIGIVVSVNDQHDYVYRVYPPITWDTKFNKLDKDLQGYVSIILEAKKKLEEAPKDDDSFSARLNVCNIRYTMDENVLLYLLRRWSLTLVKIPVRGGHAKIDMTRKWFLTLDAYFSFIYNCLYAPDKLVQDTVVDDQYFNPQ